MLPDLDGPIICEYFNRKWNSRFHEKHLEPFDKVILGHAYLK